MGTLPLNYWFVVSERDTFLDVGEVSNHGDSEGHDFSIRNFWAVVTLQAGIIL